MGKRNEYFKEMQRLGIKWKRKGTIEKSLKFGIAPPYSKGQSYAYKFWAIADRYNANEIIVDDLSGLNEDEVCIMLSTFALAGIKNIVIKKEQPYLIKQLEQLNEYGCHAVCECKVFRQETQLYIGELEIINGIKMRISEYYF